VGDLEGLFDGGVCIEVIEHLTPAILRTMVAQLAARSTPGALYYFNSGQPSFVDSTDPGYLDPKRRGHIVSWSIEGARNIFSPAGFNIIPIPARDWAFFAEFRPPRSVSVDDLVSWLRRPVPENLAWFRRDAFGQLLETIGVESALCYLQGARANWAIDRAAAPERQVPATHWPGARTARLIVSRLGLLSSR
jgi:hypothetical protein